MSFFNGASTPDYDAPFSDFYARNRRYDGKKLLCFTEKGDGNLSSFFTELNFDLIKINGVEKSDLFYKDIFKDQFLSVVKKDGERVYELYCNPLNLIDTVKLNFKYSPLYPYLTLSDGFYFITSNPQILTKTTDKFEITWQQNFNNSHKSGSTNVELFSFEDSIISNIGYTDDVAQSDGEIISLYKESGETKWSKHFDHEVHSCIVINDRIYVTGHNLWYVLAAQSGEVLLKGDAKLGDHIEGTGNSLWSDGSFLYFSSSHGNLIRIYDEANGKFWGDINMPDGYKVDWSAPSSKDGYHYFKLIGANWAEQGTVHGVLVTSTEEIKSGVPFNIEIETYDTIKQNLVETKGESLVLEFDEKELGNILRFGQIEANKYVVNNTYNLCASMAPDYGQHINKGFNGEVIIKVNKDTLEQPMGERLDLMCEFINDHNKDCIAPFKKQKVKAKWEWI